MQHQLTESQNIYVERLRNCVNIVVPDDSLAALGAKPSARKVLME